MGFAYYGRYAEYFEVGRVELVRALGIPYKAVEAQGIMMPVRTLVVNYRQPARYDDLITIRTMVPSWPQSRFPFDYEILGPENRLLATGKVELVFVDMSSKRPVRAPAFILEALEKIRPA